ncbi:728_t:CDS:2, partial [Acaulospora colombiana]
HVLCPGTYVDNIRSDLCNNMRKRATTRRVRSLTSYYTVEGVSILRPLKGLDPNMYESLETSFTQLYPKFEIIFAVADPDDPSLKIARELIEKYPDVDARITIGEQIVGVNPKINNLMEAFGTAKYDILWVIDSNAQVVPDTLARSVDSLTHVRPSKPRVGLVHHVPYAIASAHDSTIGTQLE